MRAIGDDTSRVVPIIRRSSLQMSQKLKHVRVSDLNPATNSGVVTLQNVVCPAAMLSQVVLCVLTSIQEGAVRQCLVLHLQSINLT